MLQSGGVPRKSFFMFSRIQLVCCCSLAFLIFASARAQDMSLVLESVHKALDTFSDQRVQSQLLSELAQHQLTTGQCDAALQTFAAIPVPMERRIALLTADFQSFTSEKAEALFRLLKADPQTQSLTGLLARAMLEAKNTAPAWKLVETDKNAFESEQQQYDFLEKVLPQLQAEDWEKIPRFYRTFAPGMYQDWALLAIIKYLAGQQRYDEAEKFAGLLALPTRFSWAYWEICRLSPAELSEHYFDKAIEVIETVEISPNDEETTEMLAVQLRKFGRIAFQKEQKSRGERLLKKSEVAAASLTVPMQRYRQQCFLGKVFVELKQIESIGDYLAIDTMLESLSAGLDRSRVLVWLAEAGWSKGWT
jgi:predicted negative regulator of RcsB-dependent stress response